jgi:hypothetical protein
VTFDTPVAFIIFNRPQQTTRVFRRLAELRPARLFVIADGPRGEGEIQRVDDARAVLSRIDWPCDLQINFSEKNLGCRRRVASGLDWVFHHVDRAIILEDDCLPDLSFFHFCADLLARHADEPRVSMISGDNFQFGQQRGDASYYFSRITHIWGWATWRRAWQHYDVNMRRWGELRNTNWLATLLGNQAVADFYAQHFDRTYLHMLDSWDFQWSFCSFLQDGLSAIPQKNLVSNIGFGADATHTRGTSARESNMLAETVKLPLIHPRQIERNVEADNFTFANGFKIDLTRPKTRAA